VTRLERVEPILVSRKSSPTEELVSDDVRSFISDDPDAADTSGPIKLTAHELYDSISKQVRI